MQNNESPIVYFEIETYKLKPEFCSLPNTFCSFPTKKTKMTRVS